MLLPAVYLIRSGKNEGGAVCRSDSWGTKNTATGEYREGKPYDYVHFEGKNPKYN